MPKWMVVPQTNTENTREEGSVSFAERDQCRRLSGWTSDAYLGAMGIVVLYVVCYEIDLIVYLTKEGCKSENCRDMRKKPWGSLTL